MEPDLPAARTGDAMFSLRFRTLEPVTIRERGEASPARRSSAPDPESGAITRPANRR